MRISDWSSDVCSSDLGAAGDRDRAALSRSRLLSRAGERPFRRRALLQPRGRRHAGAACGTQPGRFPAALRSEEHTSELQSLMRISYAVFCLKKKTTQQLTEESIQHDTTNIH